MSQKPPAKPDVMTFSAKITVNSTWKEWEISFSRRYLLICLIPNLYTMKINTELLNIIFINKNVFSSISIVEDMLFDIAHNHLNATLLQKSEGKFSYKIKSKETSYFLKIWQSSGLKERIKNFIRIDRSNYEYRNINYLRSKGVIAPEVFYFARIREKELTTNVLVTEYISTNLPVFLYIENNCSSRSFDAIIIFTEKILTLTEEILNAGIIDLDHNLSNMLVNDKGDLVKIDLELAVKKNIFNLKSKKICRMYSSLITSYVFAVQPNLELASKFTLSLYKKFELDSHSIEVTNKLVMTALERQLREKGIDSRFDLPN